MRQTPKLQPLRSRSLIHPGQMNPVRVHCEGSPFGRHVRLQLQPGTNLYESIAVPLAACGIKSASMTLLGGYYREFNFVVAPPDPEGGAVIAFGPPIPTGHSYMVFGNATLGTSTEGAPLVHCHATIRTERGELRGGHVLPDLCTVGDAPIFAHVTSHETFAVHQVFDKETNFPALQPYEEKNHE